jgi:hypothetical protein
MEPDTWTKKPHNQIGTRTLKSGYNSDCGDTLSAWLSPFCVKDICMEQQEGTATQISGNDCSK